MGVAGSATGALRDAYDARAQDLDRILGDLVEPDPLQTGVIACVGGVPVALDAFDKPETLGSLWSRLVSGYALDALGCRPAPARDEAITAFIEDAAGAHITTHEGVGLGTDAVITSRPIVGSALMWEGGVVHLALFGQGDPRREHDTRDGRMASPSRRRNLRRPPSATRGLGLP
jgi:hypothetical protein